jgi:WD40 repeat protein
MSVDIVIPEDLTAGIVQILRNEGIVVGTGFLVSNNLIVTCAHVIQATDADPGNKVKVRFYLNGNECNAIVMPEFWHSPDKEDLSLLQLEEELPLDVKALSLGSSAGIIDHKVCTFGFPVVGEIEGIWGHGEVRGKVTERGNSLLQIDSNEITAGFSGAPLWDEFRNRVIGIVVSVARKDSFGKLQNVAFAIPSEILQSICPELKIKDICPYKGLFSFKEDDEYLFFGRKELIQKLVKQLRINPRFIAVVGSSGSGKSSLVFAGLLPRIKRREIVGFENAQVVTFRPNDVSRSDSPCDSDPIESLRQALEKSEIHLEKADLWEGICSYLEKKPEIRLVLYADQFETLFANVNEVRQKEFLQGIYGLLKSKLKISFLLTVRGDYYDFLLNSLFGEYLSVSEGVSGGQVNVRSMSEEEMREAIKKPADVIGLEIETGLEDLIINDLKNTKNPLPLLEFTLTQLWESRSNGMLIHESYSKIGGATGAIGQWANETYNSLNTEEKELSRKIFTRLIHYGERDLPDSRRRLSLESLAGDSDKQTFHQLIKKLADAHILVTDCDAKGNKTVEIIHDSLLIEWEQLKKWINVHRGFLTWRQRLEDRMDEWNRREDEGNLLRGAPLVEAKDWLVKFKEELNPYEIEYIKASSELAEKERAEKEWAEKVEKERAEKERSRTRIIKRLAAFSIVILILAGFAISGWYTAKEKTKEASASNLNLHSLILQGYATDIDKSVLLAIESFRIFRTSTADQLIRQGLLFIPHSVVMMNHDDVVYGVVFSPDGKYIATASRNGTARLWNVSTGKQIFVLNYAGWVNSVVFSPDGKYIATASRDNTARLWDASTGKQIFVLNHDNWVNNVVFSPDGKYIATASRDNTARLWDASTGEPISDPLVHNGSVNNVAFSPDEKYLATASWDNTARLWNLSTGTQKFVLNHDDPVLNIVFSPDGKYIVTASHDSVARLWDASTGTQKFVLNHGDMVCGVAFNPDGKYVATSSRDGTARLWDVSTGKQIFFLNHGGWVNNVLFSPDGKCIATTSYDNTSKLWDAFTGKQIFVMNHNGTVYGAVFSPDGKYIATASADRTARLWDTSTGVLNHDDWVNSVVFSPDGKYVATASRDNTSRIWDASTGKQITVPLKHNDCVNSVVFSPDGKYIATASSDNTAPIWEAGKYIATASVDKTARVWNASTGKQIFVLNHDGGVNSVVFSPDGKYIATSSNDNTSKLWDAFTGKPIFDPLKHNGSVRNVVFSPDGKYVATASYDNTARLWDASTGKQIFVMNHDGGVNSVVFSPDGKHVATASRDNTARLWNLSTGTQKFVLNHDGGVNNVAFSPDGKYIATASGDYTARVWDAATCKEITVPLKHRSAVNSVVFSPDGKYVATASSDYTACLWNAFAGEQIFVMDHHGSVYDVVFSFDGKYVATASADSTARLWTCCTTEDLIKEAGNRLTRNLNQDEWKRYMGDEPYHKTFPNLP